MTIKVKGIRTGYFGGRVVPAGAEFNVESKSQIGSWMSAVTEEIKAPKTQKGDKKNAQLSEADDLA